MGIREKLNNNKPLSYAICGILLAAAVLLAYWLNSSGLPSELTRFYYTDDDGRTFFADDVKLVPPFSRNGKEAVGAYVYQAGTNPPFVAYLQKFTPQAQEKLKQLMGGPQNAEIATQIDGIRAAGALLKKPGDADWHPARSSQGDAIMNVRPPSGQSGPLKSVYP